MPFFEAKGYRVICPNVLGAGETDRPADTAVFRRNLLAADIIDILDAEKVDKVVGVGHDWYSHFLLFLALSEVY